MKPRKLKELLTFAIVHKAPEQLTLAKRDLLESALMKLNTDELETLEEYMGAICDSAKTTARRRREDVVVEGVGNVDFDGNIGETA